MRQSLIPLPELGQAINKEAIEHTVRSIPRIRIVGAICRSLAKVGHGEDMRSVFLSLCGFLMHFARMHMPPCTCVEASFCAPAE